MKEKGGAEMKHQVPIQLSGEKGCRVLRGLQH